MLQESLLLGRKYPSGMFNNSYRYVHIQSTKLIKILNEIVSITGTVNDKDKPPSQLPHSKTILAIDKHIN
jgi:hypothetical protein